METLSIAWEQDTTTDNTTLDLTATVSPLKLKALSFDSLVNILMKDWSLYIFCSATLFSIGGTLGNILTIAAFIRDKNLQKPTNYLIVNLALNDLLSSIFLVLLAVNLYTTFGIRTSLKYKYVCLIGFWMAFTSVSISVWSVAAISAERLFAVTMPLKHRISMTPNVAKITICFIWLTICLTTFPLLFGLNAWRPGTICSGTNLVQDIYYEVFFVILPSIAIGVVATCSGIIAVVVYKRRNKVSPDLGIAMAHLPSTSTAHKKHTALQSKTTKMILTIVGVFFVCWMPFIVTSFCLRHLVASGYRPSKSVSIFFDFTRVLMTANPICNPIIYAWQSSSFWNSYKRILRVENSIATSTG